MTDFVKEIRFAWRQFLKNPGFTLTAVLTLALGIAANTTIFSWINATLLNPIPEALRTRELVSIMRGERNDSFPAPPFSYLDYSDLRAQNQSLCGLLAYHDNNVSLTDNGKPQRVYGVITSANYFDVLGVRPILGRTFFANEEQLQGSSPVVVIGYGLWQTLFGGDRSAIGRTIEINRHPFTVIGVAPPGFVGAKTALKHDLWVPLTAENDAILFYGDRMQYRNVNFLQLLGRLKRGVASAKAEREIGLLMQQIAQAYPDSHKGLNAISFDPLWRSPFGANIYLAKVLPILMAIAGLVLLLACANVANLLLVRLVARRREIAVRVAIGSSRWRLLRQVLIESLLLALTSGAVAALLTTWTATTMNSFVPATALPVTLSGHVDGLVLAAAVLISLIASLASGILPALRSSNLAPVAVLKEEEGTGGLHKGRLASGLVVTQLALSFMLLVCAGLFVRTLLNAEHADPGFDPNNVLLANYELLPAGYDGPRAIEFHRQLIAKLRDIPGVESATIADWAPLSIDKRTLSFSTEGYVPRPNENMESRRVYIGPGYFHTMRLPLIEGREFTDQDTRESQPVVVVNRAFAERYWPEQDPVGKKIDADGRSFAVVGVAGDSKAFRLNNPGVREEVLYLALLQDYVSDGIIHVRTSGDPLLFAPQVEQAVHELNHDLPVFLTTTLKKSMRISTVFERLGGVFVGSLGFIALILASVGLYGVVSYSTRQRTREIGIRVALGARQEDVVWQVLRHGLRLVLIGLGIGLVLALVFTRVVRSLLVGVGASDALTYISIAVILTVVALVACYLPARRASAVDPMSALRYE
jgi:predicted permease